MIPLSPQPISHAANNGQAKSRSDSLYTECRYSIRTRSTHIRPIKVSLGELQSTRRGLTEFGCSVSPLAHTLDSGQLCIEASPENQDD